MAAAASDKKGIDIVIIKMRKVSDVCDYFIIASGTSTTHVRALSDHMIEVLGQKGEKPRHIEGQREASWVLIDFGDVVGHVFQNKTRKFYDLERLWAKAPQMKLEEPEPKKKRVISILKGRRLVKKSGLKKSVKRTKKKSNR